MRKLMLVSASAMILLSSCVSQKKYAALEAKQMETQDMLNSATVKLNSCLAQSETLREQIGDLRKTNNSLIDTQGNLTTLSTKGAENLEKSLEQMKEKDLQIKTFRDALNKKDSVTLALVTSLKGAIGNLNDDDIQINVEKGVVYVSISDKLLFNSGRWDVTSRAKEVLGKVATVVKNKPEIEFMVEGHTDSKSISTAVIEDNWDLSVKRATSVVRILQKEFGVPPERMVAAGRSYYVPLASNDTEEGRARNRRTRIVVLPKLDQFYKMIEDGMPKEK
ncbi:MULTISPECIES: OmpA family protein [Leeuwenhoekiella]|uniref:Chemotaxis protein MotB n=1 Tax=Leeuwenhoekiella aequorea TaxID=283736 RepID=A0A4Q0P3V5_9FLAO|nr:OmpA family protein [Leeuwenhoekiella aequorea]RXG21061.1 chemotaxis protein MotB [Leeuwenhoekiella aequorea]|tara:strand:- start:288 stop:1121 length:834 start_codon:yes stop_codon:yes gene_type:complete